MSYHPAVPSRRRHLTFAPLLIAALVMISGCGSETATDGTGDRSTTTLSAAEIKDFCVAIKALDGTDGTTDESVVLEVLDDVVRTAPEPVREDVRTLTDNLIIDNYPSGKTESMKRSSVQDGAAAGQRLGAFVEQHCGVSANG